MQKNSPLDKNCIDDLSLILKLKNVKRNEYLLRVNSHSKELFFIKKGIVKFCFNGYGKEFIMRFFDENILFADIESYFKKRHPKYEIVVIENTGYYTLNANSTNL